MSMTLEQLKELITQHPDFPKPGIVFCNILPIFRNAEAHQSLVNIISDCVRKEFRNIDAVAGLESRGFLIGASLALKLQKPFIVIRKQGKLPGKVLKAVYEKEYGSDVFEIEASAVKPDTTYLVVDDLLATGGTMLAAIELLRAGGAKRVDALAVVHLDALHGETRLPKDTTYRALLHY